MANEKENIETEVDNESINIDDIEGLERDLPSDEMVSSFEETKESNEPSMDEIEPLEILPDGKLKTSTKPKVEETPSLDSKPSLKDRLKDRKILMILIVVLVVLILTTIAFIFLSEKPKVTEEKPVQVTAQTKELPPIDTYEFKLDHINISRLNKKLEVLTKYELLGMTEEEYLKEEKLKALKKAKEEEELKLRLEQEAKEKEALEKAKAEELALQEKLKEEEALKAAQEKQNETAVTEVTQSENQTPTNTEQVNDEQAVTSNENTGNTFLKFVQINTNKKSIYKTYLKELKKIDSRLNACRNINNYIEVFVGPLNDEEESSSLIEAIKETKLSNSVIFVEVTKEEFANRCMVYEN